MVATTTESLQKHFSITYIAVVDLFLFIYLVNLFGPNLFFSNRLLHINKKVGSPVDIIFKAVVTCHRL